MSKNIFDKDRITPLKVALIGLNASYNHTNLAIRYLKRYCRQKTMEEEVELVCREFTINDPIRESMESLLQENADIYGFSCYIWNITLILEMTEMLKKLKPGCVFVLGGPEVSFENEQFFHTHPEIDYLIQGSGEKAFADLISTISNQRRSWVGQVSQHTYKNLPDSASPVSSGLSDFPNTSDFSPRLIKGESIPLNVISFVYETADFAVKQKQYYYETTRGCPFNCSYCLSSTDMAMDLLSMERIENELDFFIHQKIKLLKLVDRTFNFDDQRAMAIWRFLIEKYRQKPFQTKFHFEIAADLLSQEALSLLSEAPDGLFQFEIGVQTTNEKVLEKIQRKSTLRKIYENVIRIKENGNIAIHLDLIAGLPDEDWHSFAKSFHDVFSLRPDMLQLGFLKVLKGSPIRRETAKYHLIYPDHPPYEIEATSAMSFQELNRLKNMEDLLERYYNSSLFRYSLEYILRFFPNSFAFFEQLEEDWRKKGLFKRALSRQEIIREFHAFGDYVITNADNGRTILNQNERSASADSTGNTENRSKKMDSADPAESNKKSILFADLLKFDYYRFDKKGNLDELGFNFSHHHPSLPRSLEKDAWYQQSGQPICNKPRLERYSFDADQLIQSNRIVPQVSFVLYEMNGDRPRLVDVLTFPNETI